MQRTHYITKQKTIFLTLLLLFTLVTFGYAQTPSAVLAFFDGNVQIFDESGFEKLDFRFGEPLGAGFRIETRQGSAELQLLPNRTIMRLTAGTTFVINAIQGAGGATTNDFTVQQGRVRTVVARSEGADYRFRTATAVGGVRGTDFGIDVIPGEVDQLFVRTGAVEFTNLGTGESLLLGAGQIANTFAPVFQAIALSAQQINELFSGLDFIQLQPQDVPGQPEEQTETTSDEPSAGTGTGDTPAAPPQTAEEQERRAIEQAENVIIDRLLEFLSLQVGSVTINGITYGQAIFQPKFEFRNFRTQLYLPIIYTNDLFDRSNWYRGQGNDEWSFGTDQDGTLNVITDIVRDLILKIKFLEIGNYRDPFFLKLGNIESMTLGHGILINEYRNDADFPAVRRVGFNLGVNTERFGFELLLNDLAVPEIFGTRVLWRPFGKVFPVGVALSLAADINPARELKVAEESDGFANFEPSLKNLYVESAKADPIFTNFAVDLDIPIVETGFLSLVLFGDFGLMIPYIRNEVTIGGQTVGSGYRADSLLNGLSLRNYGIQTGIFGNIAIVDYRLEFQYYNGNFIPNFYTQPYDRIRGERVTEVLENLANPNNATMESNRAGIFGTGRIRILPTLNANIGYRWPWVIGGAGSADVSADDYFHIGVDIQKGLLPLGIYGSVQYDRVRFRNIFTDDEFTLFDENAVVSGSLGIEISPIMDLHLNISTSVVRDSNGVVQYRDNGRPKFGPTVTLETRIGF